MASCIRREHTGCDPEVCTPAKLRLWRERGSSFGATYQGGREAFHTNDSIRAQEKAQLETMKAAGIPFDRAPS